MTSVYEIWLLYIHYIFQIQIFLRRSIIYCAIAIKTENLMSTFSMYYLFHSRLAVGREMISVHPF